jgi:cytochrome P450
MEAIEAVARLMTPEGRVDPYPLYRVLHGQGAVIEAGPMYLVVTSYAAADAVLRDPHVLVFDGAMMVDGAWPEWRTNWAVASIATSMLRRNPPDHTRMRRLASGAFTARRVAAMRGVVAAQAAALARIEAQVAFPLLLRELGGLALAGEPERRDRLTLRGYARLPVTTTP